MSVKDLIAAAFNKDASAFESAFSDVMKDKVSAAIDSKFYGSEEADLDESKDEDEDDMDESDDLDLEAVLRELEEEEDGYQEWCEAGSALHDHNPLTEFEIAAPPVSVAN